MPRKKCCRKISKEALITGFAPIGCTTKKSNSIQLNCDEFEAIRLADHMGLYHQEAAEKMEISRATFGRILSEARRKVAEALIYGRKLQIESSTALCARCGNKGCGCIKSEPQKISLTQ